MEKIVMAPGSFGVYPKYHDNGKRVDGKDSDCCINVWFCGGDIGPHHTPCAHLTRREARQCPRRPEGRRR